MSKLVEMLDTGVVGFSFRKRDSSVRKMLATRDLRLIPKESHPQGLKDTNNEVAVPVYDIEAKAWRSYKPDSVLTVDSYRNF